MQHLKYLCTLNLCVTVIGFSTGKLFENVFTKSYLFCNSMYMLCSHTRVIQLATNISYFFSKINYFIITHMTSLHCALCPLSNASYNIQAEYIYKIFSRQFFSPHVALWSHSGYQPPFMGLHNDTHWTHHTQQDSSGRVTGLSRDLYLTKNSTHKRWSTMLLAGFKPTIPASERPQIYALDCTAIGIDLLKQQPNEIYNVMKQQFYFIVLHWGKQCLV